LIKRLIVNGCSFTHGHLSTPWAKFLAQESGLKLQKNLASGGAGNEYICRSTLNNLESQPDPTETLVIVMWSGTSRIDVPVSAEWYKHIRSTFGFGRTDGVSNWIHTGSSGNVPVLENLCKTNDNKSMCISSLQNFILLETYLRAKGYRYIFTSYANYWSKTQEYCATTDVDPNIGYHCGSVPLYQNFDFTNWLFMNSNRDCFAELALDDIRDRADAHPSSDTHQQFALEFLLPAVQKLL
jgi:hypothetical protein